MQYIKKLKNDLWTMGNDLFVMEIAIHPSGTPYILKLCLIDLPILDASPGDTRYALRPIIEIDGISSVEDLVFKGIEGDEDAMQLKLVYQHVAGLEVTHCLQPSQSQAAWTSKTILSNGTDQDIGGIGRMDALNMVFTAGSAPRAGYVLGWLDGPRADAPGRHSLPHPYPSWIPKLLYGDKEPFMNPAPQGGWTSPVLRFVEESLNRLPLRSGKRATYENYPWAVVMDSEKEGGFFAGFKWSGTWKMDLNYEPDPQTVSCSASMDSYVHTVKSRQTLETPEAFMGVFTGGWDDAFDACRRYAAGEILPPMPENFPTAHYATVLQNERLSQDLLFQHIEKAAEAGFESLLMDAKWWSASPKEGDFSIGLGDFQDNRTKFENGLKVISEYVHRHGMKFGLWFEFERVDLRTANKGPVPWSPEWLVHRDGYPHRSWCQHVYCLCLGVKKAAHWALENISRSIEAYGVDWMMIDSNEWAVCNDPSHDHGEKDGEWAQIRGLYYVLEGLRKRFPHLIIENCAGGSQRGDFGMAQYCDVLACHDTNNPSAINRKYSHGVGCMYPGYYGVQGMLHYPSHTTGSAVLMSTPEDCTHHVFEWRCISRMMGLFQPVLDICELPPGHFEILKNIISTYKSIKSTLRGKRYVIEGPYPIRERENQEGSNWETYQYVSPGGDMASVFVFRCMSPEEQRTIRLKGLDDHSRYSVHSYSGQIQGVYSGEALMLQGLPCTFQERKSADVLILRKQESV